MEMVEMRFLGPHDAPLFKSIVEVFRGQAVTDAHAEVFLSHPDHIIACAYEDGRAVGYVLAYRMARMDNAADDLRIHHVFVAPDHQRQGLASKLLGMMLDYARGQRLHYVSLTTQSDNVAANALYRKMGGFSHPLDKETYFWYITGKPSTDVGLGPECPPR